jgi:hypothetical protein
MNFFDDRELARRFKQNAVPSQERFLYYISTTVLGFVLSSVFAERYSVGSYDTISDIIILFMTIVGTILCYRINKSGDDKEFIERIVSLGFPAAIQALLLLFLVGTASIIILNIGFGTDYMHGEPPLYTIAAIFLFLIYYYWRLSSAFRIAAH